MSTKSTKLSHELRTHPPVFMNDEELAFVTGLSKRSLRNYAKAGIIPRVEVGRRVIYRWADVEAALAKLTTAFGTTEP